MDLTHKCVQAGQLAQPVSDWAGEIRQLTAISWLLGDPKLQVLLLNYGTNGNELCLWSPGWAKKHLQCYM